MLEAEDYVVNRFGFTIAEVVVAVLVLSIGLLSLVGTAALATRMIAQGERYTRASVLAAQRLAILRSQGCPPAGGGSATHGRFHITWAVSSEAVGGMRATQIIMVSPTARGARRDTVSTTMLCQSGRG